MSPTARDAYLEAQVRTATPQRLRLMLIDGALRFARQSIELWDNEQQQEARFNALVRCREIIAELYGAIHADHATVAEQVKAIYRFLFWQLAEASLHNDCQKVRDVVEVLGEERETWRQLCEKMPEPPPRDGTAPCGGREITARDCSSGTSPLPALPGQVLRPPERFSLEA